MLAEGAISRVLLRVCEIEVLRLRLQHRQHGLHTLDREALRPPVRGRSRARRLLPPRNANSALAPAHTTTPRRRVAVGEPAAEHTSRRRGAPISNVSGATSRGGSGCGACGGGGVWAGGVSSWRCRGVGSSALLRIRRMRLRNGCSTVSNGRLPSIGVGGSAHPFLLGSWFFAVSGAGVGVLLLA